MVLVVDPAFGTVVEMIVMHGKADARLHWDIIRKQAHDMVVISYEMKTVIYSCFMAKLAVAIH